MPVCLFVSSVLCVPRDGSKITKLILRPPPCQIQRPINISNDILLLHASIDI